MVQGSAVVLLLSVLTSTFSCPEERQKLRTVLPCETEKQVMNITANICTVGTTATFVVRGLLTEEEAAATLYLVLR